MVFCIMAILCLLAACGAPAVQAPIGDPAASQLDIRQIEKRIHALINVERTDKGLNPLKFNNALSAIARAHSRDMGRRDYFSHQTPEGLDPFDRYDKAAFKCEVRVGSITYMGAENIGFLAGYSTVEDIAQNAVVNWMNSSGHRKNILTPHWLTQGIGVYITPTGVILVTQNFC